MRADGRERSRRRVRHVRGIGGGAAKGPCGHGAASFQGEREAQRNDSASRLRMTGREAVRIRQPRFPPEGCRLVKTPVPASRGTRSRTLGAGGAENARFPRLGTRDAQAEGRSALQDERGIPYPFSFRTGKKAASPQGVLPSSGGKPPGTAFFRIFLRRKKCSVDKDGNFSWHENGGSGERSRTDAWNVKKRVRERLFPLPIRVFRRQSATLGTGFCLSSCPREKGKG